MKTDREHLRDLWYLIPRLILSVRLARMEDCVGLGIALTLKQRELDELFKEGTSDAN